MHPRLTPAIASSDLAHPRPSHATLASLLLHSPFGPTTTVISSNLRVEISSYFTLPGPRSPQLCSPLSHVRTSVHVCTCRVNG